MSPASLIQAPTGIGWNTIPSLNATADEQLAEQTNICWRATHTVDAFCNQPLRSDVVIEEITGPDFRLTVPPGGSGAARMIASRWPVTNIIYGQLIPASVFNSNPQWTPMPAYLFRPSTQSIQTVGSSAAPDASGAGPNFIEISPGYISWWSGRNAYRLQVAYQSGWPHATLTADALAGATSLEIDDVSGWEGAIGQIYDGGNTESVTATSATATTPATVLGQTVQTGPGTIDLASPLGYNHAAGVTVTALPQNVVWAVILLCTAEALVRGATATVVPPVSNSRFGMQSQHQTNQDEGAVSSSVLVQSAYEFLAPYKRVL